MTSYSVDSNQGETNPVKATLENLKTGEKETIEAKFIIGTDGAASSIRRELKIPFEGISTDIYWGIMDCIFESDYPHAWTFGYVWNKFERLTADANLLQVSHQFKTRRLRDNSP
jgi:phenol 2-monooxygenase